MTKNKVIHSVLTIAFAAFFLVSTAQAGAFLFHPNTSEPPLELIAIPSRQAPLEQPGSQIALFQLNIHAYPTEAVFISIPENRYWTQVFVERLRMRLGINSLSEPSYSTKPQLIPLHAEQISLAF